MNKIIKKIIYKSKILEYIYKIFFIFPIKNDKIVCSNFEGKAYGESPRYIAEKIIEKNKKIDIVWVCKEKCTLPNGIRWVKPNTLKYFYELATAKVWIFNARKKVFLKKRKEQYYVQTWHGCIALKKIEKDAEEHLDEIYLLHANSDSKDIDLFISSNKMFTEQCRNTFEYYGEVIEEGTPKNDIFVNEKNNTGIKERICKELNINKKTNILLYAPTFRDNYFDKPYDLDLEKVLNILEKTTNQNWVALVKFHPKLKNNEKEHYISNKIYTNNIEKYDISELIISSELIVTDYSSVMFDGMICRKKVILYVKDYKEYYQSRGTYFSLDELPFKKATSNDEFVNVILSLDHKECINLYRKFEEKISLNETGKAAKLVANKIIDIIERKK